MKNLFVPYQLALALKDKGFDERCFGIYSIGGESLILDDCSEKMFSQKDYHKDTILAPLYQQVVDWLAFKDIYIWVSVERDLGIEPVYFENICTVENEMKCGYKDYYEALDAAINHALTLIP